MGNACQSLVLRQFRAENILLTDQDDFDAQSSGGANGPIHFGFRGVIAAHCVHRDGYHGSMNEIYDVRNRCLILPPLRLLRVLCIARNAGRRGAAAWAHDSSGTPQCRAPSANRAPFGLTCAPSNVFFSDWASIFL